MNVSDQVLAARPWIAHYPAGVTAEIGPQSYSTLVALWRSSREAYGSRVALESEGVARKVRFASIGAFGPSPSTNPLRPFDCSTTARGATQNQRLTANYDNRNLKPKLAGYVIG